MLRVPIVFALIFEFVGQYGCEPVWKQTCIEIPNSSAYRFHSPMGIDQLFGPSFTWGSWWTNTNKFPNSQPIPSPIFSVYLYGVKISNPAYDRWMMGWLRVKIIGLAAAGYNRYFIRQMLLHAEDVHGKAVGQFVECSTCDPPSTTISKYQVLPCIAVPNNEPLPPTYIIHTMLNNPDLASKADKSDYIPNQNIPSPGGVQEWNFYWRYSEFYCNALTKFRFRFIYFLGDVGLPNYELKSFEVPTLGGGLAHTHFQWIETTNLLGSDPIPEKESNKKCTSPDDLLLVSNQTEGLPRWIAKITQGGSNYSTRRCGGFQKWITFEGRCDATNEGVGSQQNPLICKPNNQTTSQNLTEMIKNMNYTPYDDYVNKRTDNLILACKPGGTCPIELNKDKWRRIPKPTTPTPPIDKHTFSYYEAPNIHARLLHGCFMIIITTFLTPVNAFIARYYKETFMQNHINFCPFWFFVHHICILFVGMFLFGSICVSIAYGPAEKHLTRLNHKEHSIYGGIIVFLYSCLVLLGGCRIPMKIPCFVCMCMHWFWATVFYLTSLCLIVHSAYSMHHNHKQTLLFCCILSLVSEIVFHVIMSVLLIRSDEIAELNKRRRYVPVAVPLRDPRYNSPDLPGTKLRVNILITQVFCCLIITVVTLYYQNIDHNFVYVPRSQAR